MTLMSLYNGVCLFDIKANIILFHSTDIIQIEQIGKETDTDYDDDSKQISQLFIFAWEACYGVI